MAVGRHDHTRHHPAPSGTAASTRHTPSTTRHHPAPSGITTHAVTATANNSTNIYVTECCHMTYPGVAGDISHHRQSPDNLLKRQESGSDRSKQRAFYYMLCMFVDCTTLVLVLCTTPFLYQPPHNYSCTVYSTRLTSAVLRFVVWYRLKCY